VFLVKSGVPYEAALRMSDARRVAFVIALGELSGDKKYDWQSGSWRKID